jgi:hypothetical protein
MSSTLILGPSRWDEDSHTEVPSWLQRRASEDTTSPLGARRGIATYLRDLGVEAVLMEDWPQRSGELRSTRFLRVIREAAVAYFLVYWPRGAR